jgi:hypothetical protein
MKKIAEAVRNLFTPREENNFRAKALHTDFLTYYLIFALFLTFCFKSLGGGAERILGFATDISVSKLYELTNAERTKYDLQKLQYNDSLAAAARKKAEYMFQHNYWSHYAPDGTTPWDFIVSQGYQYEYAGENLAKNFLFSQGVVDAWMNSKTHKENILRKDYTEVGFAVVNGILNGEQTTLVVQMFGKPISPIASKVEPKPLVKEISSEVLSNTSNKPLINLMPITFNMNMVFLAFLLIALGMDFYFAARTNIIRVGGKNIAHIIFIGFIFISLILFAKGSIL